MPKIDDLVQVPFPLPDPATVLGNIWITQNGIDYNISPTRLGHIYQGRRPPGEPYVNQLWWDTSRERATLRVFEKRTAEWSAVLGPILDDDGNATIPGVLDIQDGIIKGRAHDPERDIRYLHISENLRVLGGHIAGPWPGDSLTLMGNVGVNGNLSVSGTMNFASTLTTNGISTFAGPRTTISGATSVGQTLHVVGAVTLDDVITVTGATSLKDKLDVALSAKLNSTLETVGPTTLDNTLEVKQGATLDTTLQVNGATTMGSATTPTLSTLLTVYGGSVVGDSQASPSQPMFTVYGSTIHNGDLNVTGISNFSGTSFNVHVPATFDTTLTDNGEADFNAGVKIAGVLTTVCAPEPVALEVSGNSYFTQNIIVAGPGSQFLQSLSVNAAPGQAWAINTNGDIDITGNLNVSTNGTFGAQLNTQILAVAQAANVGTTLGVQGQAVVGDLVSNGNLNAPNGFVNGVTLTIAQGANVGGGLTVGVAAGQTQAIACNGAMNVMGDLAVHGNLNLSGQLNMQTPLTTSGSFTVGGDLTVNGNINLSAAAIAELRTALGL